MPFLWASYLGGRNKRRTGIIWSAKPDKGKNRCHVEIPTPQGRTLLEPSSTETNESLSSGPQITPEVFFSSGTPELSAMKWLVNLKIFLWFYSLK